MRHGNQSADEILAAEKAKDDRQKSRKRGYGLMTTRDQGQVVLTNGVKMYWPVPRQEPPPGYKGVWVYPRAIPENQFILDVDGKEIIFDAEEFRKWLRWC
jgi:hypothetical protein